VGHWQGQSHIVERDEMRDRDELSDARELHDFLTLINRVRAGSHAAALALVRRLQADMLKAIRRILTADHPARRWWVSFDIAQCAWAEFFEVKHRLEEFKRPEDMVYLTR
jgi:hypothetical protein